MSLGGGDPQMQELSSRLDELEQHREALVNEITSLEEEQRDVDEAIEAIETLDSGTTVQVPLGGGAFVRAEVVDIDEVIVDVGASYAAERDQDGAVKTLEAKHDTLTERIEELRSDISEVDGQRQQIQQQLEQHQAQQMQQLQGQASGDE